MRSRNLHPLLNFFFPRFCIGCNTPGVYICVSCSKKIGVCYTQKCYKCHKPSPYGMTHWGCRKENSLIGIFSLFLYRGLGGRVMKYAKYKREQKVIDDLFSSAPSCARSTLYDFFLHTKPSVLIPIPLHRSVVSVRGFNQSDAFSQLLTRALNIPTFSILEKLSERAPQSKMPSNMRKKNVRGSYNINNYAGLSIGGRTVCIVDDVVTTGATLEEASRVLKPYTNKVYGVTLFRSFE